MWLILPDNVFVRFILVILCHWLYSYCGTVFESSIYLYIKLLINILFFFLLGIIKNGVAVSIFEYFFGLQTFSYIYLYIWLYVWLLREKAMATYSSTLAWRIPWTEEPDGLQTMGSRRVGHDWAISLSFSLSWVGEGNGNPLEYYCLENPRYSGAWWAAVYGVAKTRAWLMGLSSSSWLLRCANICLYR